jgi:hypothetical protein
MKISFGERLFRGFRKIKNGKIAKNKLFQNPVRGAAFSRFSQNKKW